MKLTITTLVIICLLVEETRVVQTVDVALVVEILGKTVEIIKTAKDIIEYIKGVKEGKSIETLDDLADTIINKLDVTEQNIKAHVDLGFRFEKLRETVSVFHSSSLDLSNYIEACLNSTNRCTTATNVFLQRFDHNSVIVYINWLPELLTFQIPGEQLPFLRRLAETSDCNKLLVQKFQLYYVTLLSQGITLQYAWRQLKGYSVNGTTLYWESKVEEIKHVFNTTMSTCSINAAKGIDAPSLVISSFSTVLIFVTYY